MTHRTPNRSGLAPTLAGLLALAFPVAPSAAAAPAPLAFQVNEGKNLNAFFRQGPTAAHLVLRSGTDPRIIVAFPAGNSGVGLWFDHLDQPVHWRLVSAPKTQNAVDSHGRKLYGIVAEAELDARAISVRKAILSSVRVLRDYQSGNIDTPEVAAVPRTEGSRIVWQRDRLDGAPGYRLVLTVTNGTLHDGRITAANGTIRLRIEAQSGETPLTPLDGPALLTSHAAADPATRNTLGFLSYREKFLAGSWRFDTYFGRDTLMSVRLLMPALQPDAVESGLRSVLVRLSPEGNVAHEEDIGEFAVLDHMRAGEGKSAAPTYDYKMIDSPFLLAPVARAWLLDDPRGRARAAAFLAQPSNGKRLGDALMTNLRFVAARTTAFADDPRWQNLVSLKPGVPVGEWRDSNDGLGGGRYPYDVNAILVPAALDAAQAMEKAGLLKPYLHAGDAAMLDKLRQAATVWRDRAPPLFLQSVDPAAAQAAITHYAKSEDIPDASAIAAAQAPIAYNAIALDAAGKPVPIVNSDANFALLFAHPDAQALQIAADTIARPFPAGLMTGAGMVVANPVFADPAWQNKFGRNAYHGTVIWSWQQALAAAGLARQLERTDLPVATCHRLQAAQGALWHAIDATRAFQSSELWSWRYAGGYQVVPFGAGATDADESNAAQLWSTVYLALSHPRAGQGCAGK